MTGAPSNSVPKQELTDLERRFLNACQHDFPLSARPFEALANELDCDEQELTEIANDLDQRGVITRIGAVYRPNKIGVSTLAAMAIPRQELEAVADIVSAFPEVNHNYEREHRLNLWFVAVADDQAALSNVLATIEEQTGYAVVDLPMTRAFHLDLGFQL